MEDIRDYIEVPFEVEEEVELKGKMKKIKKKVIEVFPKFNDEIYTNISKLAKDAGINRSNYYYWIKTEKYDKLEKAGIELVYCRKTSNGRFWICSDGDIRNKQFKSISRGGRKKTLVRIDLGYGREIYGVANLIFKAFVDPTHNLTDAKDEEGNIVKPKDKVFFFDGNIKNCRLENLAPHDKAIEEEG